MKSKMTKLVALAFAGSSFIGVVGASAPMASASSAPTATVSATNVVRYTGTFANNYGYSALTNGTAKTKTQPLVRMTGTLYSNGVFQSNTAGPTQGLFYAYTQANDQYNTYETTQWQDTTGVRAVAPTDFTVTRYVMLERSEALLRSSMSHSSSSLAGSVPSGTALVGHYVNSHWFLITQGQYAGKYISQGVIFTTNNMSQINGKMTGNDLCAVPNSMRRAHTDKDQYMGCEALQQMLVQTSQTSAPVGIVEGYRTYATQVSYLQQFGYPRAAYPGTSNHGLGNAVDLYYSDGGANYFTSKEVVNFTSVGRNNGFYKPSYLGPGSKNPEPWHFEFWG